MADEGVSQSQNFLDYVNTANVTSSLEQRLVNFVQFMRSISGVELGELEIDNQETSGRVYGLLGKLLFEFKRNLHWQLAESDGKLIAYLTDLKSRSPLTTYKAVATDGLHFHVYMPRYDDTGSVLKLERVNGLNMASPLMTPERAVQELAIILS